MMPQKKHIVTTLKILLSICGLGYISYLVYEQLHDSFLNNQTPATTSVWFLFAAIMLMPINWIFESIKWKILTNPIHSVTFKHSLYGVLSGIAVSLITPNRMGEFAGKILVLPREKRIEGAFASVIGSFSQLMFTVIIGILGISLMLNQHLIILTTNTNPHYGILVALLLLVLSLAYIIIKALKKRLASIKTRLVATLQFIKTYTKYNMLSIVTLSGIRYLTFSIQFILLLHYFNIKLPPHHAILGTSTTFLIATSVPSITFLEFGIRGSVSAFVFGFLSSNQMGIIAASISLWIINIAIPAFAGMFVWNKLKL